MMYDTKMIEEEPKEEKPKEVNYKSGARTGTNLFLDLERLEKLIKKQIINFKRSKTDEYKIKYANSIGLLTQKKVDIACIVLRVDEIISGKSYYRPK